METFDVLYVLRGEDEISYYPQSAAARAFLDPYGADPDGGYPFSEAPDHAWFGAAGLTLGVKE